jgi:hypothetical protein
MKLNAPHQVFYLGERANKSEWPNNHSEVIIPPSYYDDLRGACENVFFKTHTYSGRNWGILYDKESRQYVVLAFSSYVNAPAIVV